MGTRFRARRSCWVRVPRCPAGRLPPPWAEQEWQGRSFSRCRMAEAPGGRASGEEPASLLFCPQDGAGRGQGPPGSEAHLQASTLSSTVPASRGPRASACHPAASCKFGTPESSPQRPSQAPGCLLHGACQNRVSGGLSEASVTKGKKGQVHDSFTPESSSHRQPEAQGGFLWPRHKSLASGVSHRQAVRGFKAKAALGAGAVHCKWVSPPASP